MYLLPRRTFDRGTNLLLDFVNAVIGAAGIELEAPRVLAALLDVALHLSALVVIRVVQLTVRQPVCSLLLFPLLVEFCELLFLRFHHCFLHSGKLVANFCQDFFILKRPRQPPWLFVRPLSLTRSSYR